MTAEADSSTPMRAFIAYRITCIPTGKSYVGITVRKLSLRWKQHRVQARHTTGKAPFPKAILKHGPKAFRVEPIASARSWPDLLELERLLIAQEGTYWPNGYNATEGGEGALGCTRPWRPGRFIDLTGGRFGRLEVLSMVGRQEGKIMWDCRCSCGKPKLVSTTNLRTGNTTSCGCRQKEATAAVRRGKPGPRAIDLTGRRFGRLEALGKAREWNTKNPKWECRCDCKTVKDIRASNLRDGITVSCGCYSVERFTAWSRSRRKESP